MSKISDLAKQGVFYQSLGEDPKPTEEDGNFVRNLKKTVPELKAAVGGAIALGGDLVGADGVRDYGLGIYEKNNAEVQGLTRDSDSFSNALEGNTGTGEFLSGAAGYVTGQAATALATGGLGGFIGSQLAKRGIKEVVARGAESAAAKAVAGKVASQGAKAGAGTALFGQNLTMEAGSIYPEALQHAEEEGRELTGADKARIVGSSVVAAGVDTAMDAMMAGRVLAGGRRVITNEAGEQVVEGMGRAAMRELPGGMAREAVTEGIQTGIERFGAGKELSTADAIREYVDSMAVGAVGGGLGGAASVLHAQKVPESGMLTKAANAGIEDKILQLEHDPQPLIAFPDGSVGYKQDLEAYLSQFTDPEERTAKHREIMGRDPATGKKPEPEPVPEPMYANTPEAEKTVLKTWTDKHDPVPLDYAQALLNTPGAKGKDLMIVPHPKGKGYTLVPSKWLTLDTQARAGALQKGDEAMLPGPDKEAPQGAIRVDSEGGAAKETYGEQARSNAAKRELDEKAAAEAKQREELGTPVPHGTKAAPRTILNPKNQPFITEFAAKRKLKDHADTHEVQAVEGGFALVPKKQTAPDPDLFTQAANEAATSPTNDLPEPTQAQKEAGNYRKGHTNLHGLDISIENPAGSTRSGVDRDGTPWKNELKHHYGYIKGTVGADKDHIDTFIGPNLESDKVFIVDQVHPDTGKFDEHKIIFGADSLDEAKAIYQANYAKDWKGGKDVSETSVEGFKTWLKEGDTTTPYAKKPVQVDGSAKKHKPEESGKKAPYITAEQADDLFKPYLKKTIPEMTDDELRKAAAHYGPDGKRTPKIQKEMKKRGMSDGAEKDLAATSEKPKAKALQEREKKIKARKGEDVPVKSHLTEDKSEPQPVPADVAPAPTWPPEDVKTYTPKEAGAEWDKSSPGFRRTVLGRVDMRESGLDTKKWEEIDPADRKKIHLGLNEDFYFGSWYINKQGTRIDRIQMQRNAEQEAIQAEIQADAAAGDRWDKLPPRERFSLMIKHGVGKDSEQGQYSPWAPLDPNLRKAMRADLMAEPEAKKPQAATPKTKASKKPFVPDQTGWGTPQEPASDKREALAEDTAKAKAQADLMAGLADLADIFGKNVKASITPEQEQKLVPVLAKVMDAAFRLGYYAFKDAGRFVYNTIRDKIGSEVSGQISLDHLQGAYISMAGKYQEQGADNKKSVINGFDTIEQLLKDENGPDNTGNQGAESLGEVASEQGEGTESRGDVQRGNTGSRDRRAQNDSGSEGAGSPADRSGGNRPSGVHSAEAGTGKSKRLGSKGAGRKGKGVSANDAVKSSAPNIPATNFRITEDVRLGKGGEVEKFNDNLAAIRTLKTIEAENRRATPEEQAILARYVGWGGLANAFPSPETGDFKDAWKTRGVDLKELLTAKEYSLARRSTLDSHYTSETIVRGMWNAARRLGFKGGLALESSMGAGNFLGLIPDDLNGQTKFIGVEYDSLTARIGTLLYPQATVLNSGFQNVPLSDGSFDLAIGNPPFGEQSLRFQFKPELNGHSIHNQFFLGALDALKPGGLQIQVVSRYLLDKQDTSSRVMLAKKAKLLGAIRLPDTAFKENARTEVVTDIVFLQRLTPAEEATMEEAFAAANEKPAKDREQEFERQRRAAFIPEWVNVTKVPDPLGGEAMSVNTYFANNPQMVMGVLERSGSMRHGADITVRLDKDRDLSSLLAGAIDTLPADVLVQEQSAIDAAIARHKDMSDALRIALSGQEAGSIKLENDGSLQQVIERETPEGDYELAKRTLSPTSPWSEQLYMDAKGQWYRIEAKVDAAGNKVKVIKDGKATKKNVYERVVYENEADIPSGLLLGEAKFNRLKAMVQIRDLLKEQLSMEAEDFPAKQIEANRKELKAAYDNFVAEHGLISDPGNSALVGNMPDGALVQALEFSYRPAISDAKAKKIGEKARPASATPAPILSERVITKYNPPESAESVSDAIAIVMAESGRVDMDRLASLMGQSVEDFEQSMIAMDKPLLFKDPEQNAWVTRNEYLSGQVKRKLSAARATGMNKNAAALEEVQPEPWGAENVTALLGSTWVPPEVYADFVQHISGVKPRVSFASLTNSFSISPVSTVKANEEEWGSEGISSVGIIDDLLNNRSVKVWTKNADGNPVIDEERTKLVQLKARAITNEFADWVFADGTRRNQLVEIFNEKFNTRVSRQHDGSHLILPGKVPDMVIRMRRHQKNAIWRGIQERFSLLDHAVGAGKTFTAIARAMERRRMGLSKKPAMIVPNHMVEQFTSDVYRLYPGAKVLAAGKKGFMKARRRKLFAKIATGDFDIVIIPHSSFGFIGIAPETEERFLEMELKAAEAAIKDAEEAAAEEGQTGWRKPFGVKEAERLAEKIRERMEKVKGSADKKDRLLTFEQMGIDDLTVDEAHEFKNLFYSSRLTGVKGMGNKTGSQKAFDLYNKVRVLRESPTGTITFMTGTPISNSAVEMYTMMRYLAADQLADLGLEHFDAWRSQFVSTDAGWEPNETGRLKEVARLGRTWSNMRSLMDLYYSFTDSVSNDDIKAAYREDNEGAEFPIPKVKGGDRQSIVIDPTPAQLEILNQTIADFDALPYEEDPFERNKKRLRLMDRARKVSLDVRAVDPRNKSKEEGGKLDKIADEVKRIYDKWTPEKGTQLIFLDRSVPKSKGDDKLIKEYDEILAEQSAALAAGDEDTLRAVGEKLEKYDANEMEELRNAQAGGWNAYQQIKDNLIARGIPAAEIRFIQEANNDAQKQALFDAVKAGEVRVLLGSTPRMGAGTNVQDRLVALHHADVTWKPSDIEQREGRIIRQGNRLAFDDKGNPIRPDFEVEILAYATERTIDAKMWNLNSAKLKTINGIRKYDGAFSMDFEDEESVSMAELAALASGDPLLLERVKLMSEIDKLELLKRQHSRKMWGVVSNIENAERDIERIPAQIEEIKADIAIIESALAQQVEAVAARRVTVDGTEYADYATAAKAAGAAIELQQKGDEKAKVSINVDGKRYQAVNTVLSAIRSALGDQSPFDMVIDGQEYGGRTDAARMLAEKATDLSVGLGKGDSKSNKIGTFMGLDLELTVDRSSWSGSYSAAIAVLRKDGSTLASGDTGGRDKHEYTTQSMTPAIADLEHAIDADRAQRSIDRKEKRLAEAKKELPALQAKRNDQFPQEQELAEKNARLEDVIRQLSASDTKPVGENPDALRANVDFDSETIELNGVERARFNSEGSIIAYTRAGLDAFWNWYGDGKVDDEGRPVVTDRHYKNAAGQIKSIDNIGTYNPNDDRTMYTAAAGGSASDKAVADMARAGKSVGEILAHIEKSSEEPHLRELARALQDLRLKTKVQFGRMRGGTYSAGVTADQATAAYNQFYDTAYLHQVKGAEQNLMHELVHAATLRALQRGGLAATQIKSLWNHVKDRTAFAGEYGITNEEEFIAEAYTNPRFRQMLADTPAPGASLSLWQKLVGIVRILLGKPAISDNVLAKVMEAGPALMQDNQAAAPATSVLRATTAGNVNDYLNKMGVKNDDIRNRISDLFESEKTFNGWWHKTVGTQYHKAQIDHHFKRVYDATQRFLSSVSLFANDAADAAPTLLPKLEGFSDLTKKPPKQADTEAAGKAIFEGTLIDQRVYSDAELVSKFQLNKEQIKMYREFRAATDKSLDDMGKTDLLRYVGKDYAHLRSAVLNAKDVNEAADIITAELEQTMGDDDTIKGVRNRANNYAQLKREGYAPLMRFGEHTVYVTDKAGNQLFFGMAETGAEAAKLARNMREIYPDASVNQGILSKEGSKLFSGISSDTIEVFANVTGLDQDPLFQDYLKLVVNNRSALKRLIHRKGVAGFSQDTTRVLASFLTSNARAAAKNLHTGEMLQAAEAIPKEKGDVRDEAIKLVDYIQNPVEEAAKVRGLLFANFIGGSLASAAVNMTQPVMMTLPYLAQFGGAGKATKTLAAAMKMAATGDKSISDDELRTALEVAERQGIVSPQEIHNLQAEAMRSSTGLSIGGKEIVPAFAARKLAVLWGGFFGLAEQFNRKATFIAAYQMARDMTTEQFRDAGVTTPYEFAVKAIAETQGVYNRGNRPDWARGAVGATLMTFKQYSIAYMEFLTRLPPKERALALAILVVAAGANGLPFADDLDDVIDTIAQALGYNWQTKKVRDRFLTNTLGQGAADFVLHGVSGISGIPLDISMRMGMQNLLPATGIFLKSNADKSYEYSEILGAAGGLLQRGVKGGEKILEGDLLGAAGAMSPTAIANLTKGIDMLHTGAYRDAKGRKVIETDTTDALVKMIGFQPADVAREQDKLGMARDTIAVAKAVKESIANQWAQGAFEKDPDAAKDARAAIDEWNRKNPESRIEVTAAQIAKRLREMHKEKADRVVGTAPKSMRTALREDLE